MDARMRGRERERVRNREREREELLIVYQTTVFANLLI